MCCEDVSKMWSGVDLVEEDWRMAGGCLFLFGLFAVAVAVLTVCSVVDVVWMVVVVVVLGERTGGGGGGGASERGGGTVSVAGRAEHIKNSHLSKVFCVC